VLQIRPKMIKSTDTSQRRSVPLNSTQNNKPIRIRRPKIRKYPHRKWWLLYRTKTKRGGARHQTLTAMKEQKDRKCPLNHIALWSSSRMRIRVRMMIREILLHLGSL
jgi:hypothetical protein